MSFRLFIPCSLLVIALLRFELYAQGIPVLKFSQLHQRLQPSSDSVYVVNFWATWCGPCVEELPVFNELARVYARKNVKFLLVSFDNPDSVLSLSRFVAQQRLLPEVVVLDEPDFDSWIDQVSPKWQGALPATLILARGGREFLERQVKFEEMRAKLDKVL